MVSFLISIPVFMSNFLRLIAASVLITFITACSTPRPLVIHLSPDQPTPSWSGKMNLTLETDPKQIFSAEFDLQGSAAQGDMQFYTSLGTTIASAAWDVGVAHLTIPQKDIYQYESLEALTKKLLGTTLPVNMIFEWASATTPNPPQGWSLIRNTAELDGKPAELLAVREFPSPKAHLHLWIQKN